MTNEVKILFDLYIVQRLLRYTSNMIGKCNRESLGGIMKKKILIVSVAVVVFILLVAGIFGYTLKLRYTTVDTKEAPDKDFSLTLQMKGEPELLFGATHGRIVAKHDGKTVQKIPVTVYDDGAMLREDNWSVEWGIAGVRITLIGSEQPDEIIDIMYDGSDTFSGYSEEEIRTEMENRYGSLQSVTKEGNFYRCDTGDFTFLVQNDLILSDSYKQEYFHYLTDAYFAGRNRVHEYEVKGEGTDICYIPVITLDSSSSEEKNWFCQDVINWLLFVTKDLPYEGNETLFEQIEISYRGENIDYNLPDLSDFTEDSIADVYNDLYEYVETMITEDYQDAVENTGSEVDESAGTQNDSHAGSEDTDGQVPDEEAVRYYLSLEPDCTYQADNGVEYRMVPVDRACGSSFYVLVGTDDQGKSACMVNTDPYLGSGGEAKWIQFLSDGKTGFSCLAYSGGAYGSLYRTEDGGKTFTNVEWPSAKAKLSDGTLYNPFVMPEKVYEKDGKLYMEVGQGADGDYYGDEGYCNGLYESSDDGKTWEYVGEVVVSQSD